MASQPGINEAIPRPEEAPGVGIVPRGDLMARVEEASGVAVSACFGCVKCSGGCPLTFAMDLHPYQVVRYVQLGLIEPLMASSTIWVCASCQTCLTRCPNGVDLPRLMDHLKAEVVAAGGSPPHPETLTFHQLFLDEVRKRGRVFEGSLMTRYLLKTGGAWGPEALANARLGWQMLRRGRLKLTPVRVRDRAWLKEVFR